MSVGAGDWNSFLPCLYKYSADPTPKEQNSSNVDAASGSNTLEIVPKTVEHLALIRDSNHLLECMGFLMPSRARGLRQLARDLKDEQLRQVPVVLHLERSGGRCR